MKISVRFLLLVSFLIFSNCKDPRNAEKTSSDAKNDDIKYKAFVEYLKSKNISICEIKEIRLKIKKNAKNLADKRYPNSIAQHDKYVERLIERKIDTVINKYGLKSSDWSKAWILADKYCK
ncbi:hypothetical protein HYN48_13655 [Flavobacterium magnum]|uniref:Uncharacterized protein n=1 Tax=Flavobacterium magnum TaxID=2162713 RepID=A0A2S0RH97_9FLAO|nr:hypothetical protein [Flavobacterium magnum]AWA31044.1 hypothetical protein HYN48_13655 [Flavobacterium magnum]